MPLSPEVNALDDRLLNMAKGENGKKMLTIRSEEDLLALRKAMMEVPGYCESRIIGLVRAESWEILMALLDMGTSLGKTSVYPATKLQHEIFFRDIRHAPATRLEGEGMCLHAPDELSGRLWRFILKKPERLRIILDRFPGTRTLHIRVGAPSSNTPMSAEVNDEPDSDSTIRVPNG